MLTKPSCFKQSCDVRLWSVYFVIDHLENSAYFCLRTMSFLTCTLMQKVDRYIRPKLYDLVEMALICKEKLYLLAKTKSCSVSLHIMILNITMSSGYNALGYYEALLTTR